MGFLRWYLGTDDRVNNLLLAVVAALLVVVASHDKRIRKIDAAARQLCLRIAAVPSFAEHLGMELGSRAEFYLVSKTLKAQVSEFISRNIGDNAINFKNDGSPSSRFTRAVALYWMFVRPHHTGARLEFPTNSHSMSYYTKVMHYERKTVSQAEAHYVNLLEIGLNYFTAVRPIQQLRDSLNRVAQETSNFVGKLIARYILLQEKTPARRSRRLKSIGFGSYDHFSAIDLNQIVAAMLAIATITIVVIMITPQAVPITPGDAFIRAIVFAIQTGLSIAAGAFVADRFLQRYYDSGERFPPLFELTVASLVVVTMSAALRIAIPLVSGLFRPDFTYENVLHDFNDRFSGLLFPFVSTMSIGLMCSYLKEFGQNRLSLAALGGLCNGVTFTATAYLVGFLLPETVLRPWSEDLATARLKITLTSAVVGVAVGAMVLAMFKIRSPQIGSQQAASQDEDECDSNVAKGRWADRPLGGYSRDNVKELEGRYVCFRPMFSNPGIINAYLITITWDLKQSCLTFQEEARADSAYTQWGQVCIPEGKPFLNFVTMDKGDVRLITVSRPDSQGLARGLILTLSNPQGVHFTPASAPVVLRRVGDQVPQLGFVHAGTTDYDVYQAQLRNVLPEFGLLAKSDP